MLEYVLYYLSSFLLPRTKQVFFKRGVGNLNTSIKNLLIHKITIIWSNKYIDTKFISIICLDPIVIILYRVNRHTCVAETRIIEQLLNENYDNTCCWQAGQI